MVATLPPSAGAAPRARTRIRAALSEVRLDPILRGLILGAVLFSILVVPVQELAPAIARRHGDGAHLLGFLLTALAAGGLVGNVVRARLDRRGVPVEKAIAGSMLLCGLMLLVVASTSNYVIVLGAMVVCGAAWDVLYVDSLTGVQFADPRRSGLMTGLFFSGTLGGVTVGALAVGALFDAIGVGWGLTVCAAATALGAVWVSRQPSAAEPGAVAEGIGTPR